MNWSEWAICCFSNLPCLALTYCSTSTLQIKRLGFSLHATLSHILLHLFPFSIHPKLPPPILNQWSFYEWKLTVKVSPNTWTINQEESGLLRKLESMSRGREIIWKGWRGDVRKWGWLVSENVSSAGKANKERGENTNRGENNVVKQNEIGDILYEEISEPWVTKKC